MIHAFGEEGGDLQAYGGWGWGGAENTKQKNIEKIKSA